MLLQKLPNILVEIEDKSAFQEEIEKTKFHEPDLQQPDIEVFFDYPCQYAGETKEPWKTFNEE